MGWADGGERYSTDQGDWNNVSQFEVRIEGLSIGSFQEVEIPSIKMEQIDYSTGDTKYKLKRPSAQKDVGDLKLVRGWNVNQIMYDWIEEVAAGQLSRKSMTIDVKAEDGNVIASFDFYHCWPKEWKLSGLKAGDNSIMTEEITFALEDLKRTK